MNIRIAQSTDLVSISEIAKISFPLACPPDSDIFELDQYISTKLDIRKFREIYQDTAKTLWVAEINSEIVGFCLLHIVNSSTAEISRIYVLPEHHGSGIATMLIESAINLAKSQNLKVIVLSVFSDNKRAKNFYEKIGFEFDKHVDFQMGKEVHKDSLMKLKIV